MSIALIITSAKKRNSIYYCIIHETNYIVEILCTVIPFLNEINLYMKKCFFQTYTTAIFHFLRSSFIIIDANFEIFIKTHVLLYFYDEIRSNHRRCSIKKLFLKICNIHRKRPALESLFNKVAGLQT